MKRLLLAGLSVFSLMTLSNTSVFAQTPHKHSTHSLCKDSAKQTSQNISIFKINVDQKTLLTDSKNLKKIFENYGFENIQEDPSILSTGTNPNILFLRATLHQTHAINQDFLENFSFTKKEDIQDDLNVKEDAYLSKITTTKTQEGEQITLTPDVHKIETFTSLSLNKNNEVGLNYHQAQDKNTLQNIQSPHTEVKDFVDNNISFHTLIKHKNHNALIVGPFLNSSQDKNDTYYLVLKE